MNMQNSSLRDNELLQGVNVQSGPFNEHEVLHELKHFLPAQAPLKDFIHHNTLHAFQKLKFHDALRNASEKFGYKVSLTLEEFREHYKSGRISKPILERVISERKGAVHVNEWMEKVLSKQYDNSNPPRIGSLKAGWKRLYHIDMDALVHPTLFRIICSYLDQGISIWNFPVWKKGFLTSIREMEHNSFTSFFKNKKARNLLLQGKVELDQLLTILVGDESLFKQYLFDQQFAHQGWSGMVSTVEDQPETLLDRKNITLHDLILFELLLEIDALDTQFGNSWAPLSTKLKHAPVDLFGPVAKTELSEIFAIWQEAFEWSYYDDVLAGIGAQKVVDRTETKSFQSLFCIDDREFSLRNYLERLDPECETFGTPGFFGVEFYFQPQDGKFLTKLCPAPVTPKFLIKEEEGAKRKRKKDVHFSKHSHNFYTGWLISQTLGFWSALRLFLNVFRPTMSTATASSFKHMDKSARLIIENTHPDHEEKGLKVGFNVQEMAQRVEGQLRSIGLLKDFAPMVYAVGHGSSSVNNPHYAAYDCGACSGRPGSVNSRVFCYMANHPGVRTILASKGILIPKETQFLGGLHDTSRDEIVFFDEDQLTAVNAANHRRNEKIFEEALDYNSKERSRRFVYVNTKLSPHVVHEKVLRRSVSLFEPRPELNHATNSLCIVGRRGITSKLFLDRRAFLNSYDYRTDLDGTILFNIMKPLGPVCGGINLEYFFSRVDNQKMGAGTKLPHNVMGLFGVANGIDGDLRPGLPSQMIEVHDPVRLMLIVEHFPEVVLDVINRNPDVYEWYINEWMHLTVINPETNELMLFRQGAFVPYDPIRKKLELVPDIIPILEASHDNLPVYQIA